MTSSDLRPRPDGAAVRRLLRDGVLTVDGRLVEASNTTLRGTLTLDGVSAHCVYKPIRGERPLWDFPDGTLADREVAAYLVAEALGGELVPPTVLRDGPFGTGSCQWWIDEPDGAAPLVGFVAADAVPPGWFPIAAARDDDGTAYTLAHADDPRLARLAVFDAVVNNADRKGGHVLVGPDDRIYGVDHGVTFHVEEKLRTVLWGWAGRTLPADLVAALAVLADRLDADLGEQVAHHLTLGEVAALRARVDRLRSTGRFPLPPRDGPVFPWPPI
ncbi:SCO1664 family protein [Micromonospora sp. NPDC000207]|uniref:SCO1664 family protein n=1 Tax=Micromonospora sp. NPDC000207 TaxID=3154246 RepID=UPI0033281375